MPKNKAQTITEVARMGGQALLRKYGKRQLREWGERGGRPPKARPKQR